MSLDALTIGVPGYFLTGGQHIPNRRAVLAERINCIIDSFQQTHSIVYNGDAYIIESTLASGIPLREWKEYTPENPPVNCQHYVILSILEKTS